VAALQLVENGSLSLDDNLSDYMPEFADMRVKRGEEILPAKNPILVRNLFTMTAGFSYNVFSPQLIECRKETGGRCPTREAMRYLAREPLLFEPGERYEYSLCHDVLAALVEVVSGMRFEEYVQKYIFKVLSMNDSTFVFDEDKRDAIVDLYEFDREKNKACVRDKHIDYRIGTEYECGGAGCISTLDDYVKFIEALRVGDIILKKETIDLLSSNQLTEEQMVTYNYRCDGYGYGLGQRCPIDPQKSDFGWGGAAGAYYAIDRKNGITVYLAAHILEYLPFQYTRAEILPIIQSAITENV
jgi:CubicO group peptidase (beta-lactamase class C family)